MRWGLLVLLGLCGCRDSPDEVVGEASEAAAEGRLVDVQSAFSVTTVQRLERAWRLERRQPAAGWQALAQKLVFDGKPLEVGEATIVEDYAQVMARAGATQRDYYLRKEDGRWRIELGGGLGFRRAQARVEAQQKKDEAAEARKEQVEKLKAQRAEQEKGQAP